MRNTIIGGVLAIVLVAALFAASYYHSPAHNPPPAPAPNPDAVAAHIKPGFVGTQLIGAWRLNCFKPRPVSPEAERPAGSNANATPPSPGPDQQNWRCRVVFGIHSRSHPAERVVIRFQYIGPKRVVLLSTQIPWQLTWRPGTDEALTLRLSNGEMKIPVRLCGPPVCLAMVNVPPADAKRLLSTSRMIAEVSVSAGAKPITFTIPVTGLRQALETLDRIDQ
jgi:invasion protein IalB